MKGQPAAFVGALAAPPIHVSLVSLGDLVGVHHNTLGNWCREGMPHQRAGKYTVVDLGPALQWIRAKDAEALRAARDRTAEDETQAKIRKAIAEARLKELDLEQREGKLLDADEVEQRWLQVLTATREAVLQLPGLAVQSALIEAAHEHALDALCRTALESVGRVGDDEDVDAA